VQTRKNCVYTPETLAMLCRVFNDSFRIAAGHGFGHSEWRDDVRLLIAQVIMRGAEKGVRDPITLRRMALTVVAMGYLDNRVVH
jgi:hypothetical protein